jgi:hypothetical protein
MIATNFRHRFLCALIALSFAAVCSTPQVHAGTIEYSKTPFIVVQSGDDANTKVFRPGASNYSAGTADGDYILNGQMDVGGVPSASVTVQQLEFNNDPFVLNNLLVTNTLGTSQVFSVTVGLPTTVSAPNMISGNVRTSVIDGGNDGATISTISGQALYQAQIDFGTVASLETDPFTLSAAPGSSSTSSATFGPTASGIPVASSIAVQLRFTLSPGDTASILSRFDVVPGGVLPEPGTLTLSAFVLAFACGARRRVS